MLDFFSDLVGFFKDVGTVFTDIISNLSSICGDVLNFTKVICWDIPNLILNEIIPNIPQVFRVPINLLFLTIIFLFFMKLLGVVVKAVT